MTTGGTRGGARPNSGRPRLTEQEKFERAMSRRKLLIDELLFPAISCALHADPGKWGDRYLEVELSKRDIELAYGREGLAEWNSFFSLKKIGGIDRFGQGYKSRWLMNFNKYGVILKFIEELGHTVKSIPKVFFPPEAMQQRLRDIHARRAIKRSKREDGLA